ncbi:hypothetical protein Peur_010667 [Populus x canadensis]
MEWKEIAYVSCRKANLNRENLCMAELIQEVICGDYAFVIQTKNPLSGIPVTGYPSKNIGLYSKPSIIFSSDSNGEDPEGYAGTCKNLFCIFFFSGDANQYNTYRTHRSALIDEEEKIVLDNSSDRKNHRKSLRSPP